MKESLLYSPDGVVASKPTNIHVLTVTAIAFGLFVIAEIIGALASNSLSLLGDGAAMSVDVFTYFSNMYAERVKARNHGILDKSTKMLLEVYIPSLSITALLAVTGYILSDAVDVIKQGESDDDVNVYFLFAFAGGNFLVDIVSSFMFYWRGKEVLLSSPISHDRLSVHAARTASQTESKTLPSEPKTTPNLNMISALTHVGSDTLRTMSVFVAAVISYAGHQNSSLCDAWAAVVVSITIVFAVIPLLKEIYHVIQTTRTENPDVGNNNSEDMYNSMM